MRTHRIEHPHNEASAMTAVHNRRVLDAFGFDVAFWIASDEAEAHKSIALLGRQRLQHESERVDGDGWQVVRVKTRRSKRSGKGKTDDPEALARAGGWIYLFGSQFGSKSGPLDPDRHFVARFNESLADVRREKLKIRMDVAREPFAIHRAINDALTHRGVQLIPAGTSLLNSHVRGTLDDADQAEWHGRVNLGDRPINVEGCCFLPSGRLLVGLRYPVTKDGHPICVEIDGIDRLFAKKGYEKYGGLQATRVFVLKDIGSAKRPAGVRATEVRGSIVHLITGDLDSDPDESQILADHPEGMDAVNEHHTFEIPFGVDSGVEHVSSHRVRQFKKSDNVEGMALFDNGTTWYVHDDEVIRLDEAPQEA